MDAFKQPMTAKQLANQTGIDLDSCSYVLWELGIYGLVACRSQKARRSRVYWLTELGAACQRKLRAAQGLPSLEHEFPKVDWNLYSWVCYSHRAAVIKALVGPLQPATIKRRAKAQDPTLRMSANNVRDVIRLFLAKEIVRAVKVTGRFHLHYELTRTGQRLRTLLLNADSRE